MRVGATISARASAWRSFSFNPRPPVRVGATSASSANRPSSRSFQSSPTGEGGRDLPNIGPVTMPPLAFQSSPTGEGGRDEGAAASGPIPSCFNPRPPVRVGATLSGAWPSTHCTFQSSPTGEGGRDQKFASGAANYNLFQSSPTGEGGRDPSRRVRRAVETRGFNPRPPVRVGATLRALEADHDRGRFQSSPTGEGGRDACKSS